MDVHYLKYLIHTNRFFYDLGTISPGGAGRNRVLSKRDFLKIKVQYPKLEEQNYASNSLKTLDGQIENFEILLTNYTQQKDGLMQMLLTGEVRVKM
jgi:type I restriction enzyme S subunit